MNVTGRLRAWIVPRKNEWRYGDRVTLTGKLLTPPEGKGFSTGITWQGRTYHLIYPEQLTLLEHGQASRVLGMLYSIRQHEYTSLTTPASAGSRTAFRHLLGIENDLSDQFRKLFGTAAPTISLPFGFNIAIIAGFFMAVSQRLFPKRWALPAALVGITFYTMLVGAQASVVGLPSWVLLADWAGISDAKGLG